MFMLPILLCVAGWVWSGAYCASADYVTDRSDADHAIGYYASLTSMWGEVGLGIGRNAGSEYYWNYGVERVPVFYLWPRQESGVFLGFDFTRTSNPPDGWYYSFSISYLFIIIFLSVILFFVWRKTRPKLDPKTAFQIEVGSQRA